MSLNKNKNPIKCGCGGFRTRNAVCKYVAGGAKYCGAPNDYECEHKVKDKK